MTSLARRETLFNTITWTALEENSSVLFWTLYVWAYVCHTCALPPQHKWCTKYKLSYTEYTAYMISKIAEFYMLFPGVYHVGYLRYGALVSKFIMNSGTSALTERKNSNQSWVVKGKMKSRRIFHTNVSFYKTKIIEQNDSWQAGTHQEWRIFFPLNVQCPLSEMHRRHAADFKGVHICKTTI